jgi:hypothetical protein
LERFDPWQLRLCLADLSAPNRNIYKTREGFEPWGPPLRETLELREKDLLRKKANEDKVAKDDYTTTRSVNAKDNYTTTRRNANDKDDNTTSSGSADEDNDFTTSHKDQRKRACKLL